MKNKLKKIVTSFIVFSFWILVWQVIYFFVGSDIIVASPYDTFKRVFSLMFTNNFWPAVLNSICHIVEGFFAAVIVGIGLAVFSKNFRFIDLLFAPILKIVKATPVASFIILALFWIQGSVSPFIAFLMVVPIIYANLLEGLKNVDSNLLEMAEIYNFSLAKKIRLIYIPSLMPYFVSAFSVGLGFAWKSGIAAEVIAHSGNSLGLKIYNAKIYLETVDIFAYTVVIIALSILMEKLFMFILTGVSKKILKGGASK